MLQIAEDTQDRLGTEEDVDLLNLAPQKIDWYVEDNPYRRAVQWNLTQIVVTVGT